MKRRHLLLATLFSATAMHTAAPAHAQRQTRTYVATANGLQTEIVLQFDGNRFEGTLREARGQAGLSGQVQGRRLNGHLLDPASGHRLMPFSAEFDADTLLLTLQMPLAASPSTIVLHRPGAQPEATAVRAPAGAAIDPRLAGRWYQQSSINSAGGAGGFASFTTVRTLLLAPDGQMQQWVRSVGGGGSWSHRSGDQLEIAARWTTQGGAMWVLLEGHAAFVKVGSYRLEDNRLITGEGSARQVWQR
jgi:hypothetical protein